MTMSGVSRTRFVLSPLSETFVSLNMLHSGKVPALHRRWARQARPRLRRLDVALLRALVPGRGAMVSAPLADAASVASFGEQLRLVEDWPVDTLRAELEWIWRDEGLPEAAQRVIADGPAGPRRIADVLGQYWEAVLQPHWPQLQAVLDAEVVHQARLLATGGVAAMMATLHPELRLDGQTVYVDGSFDVRYELGGQHLLLIPSVFSWPSIHFDSGVKPGPPSVIYGPRGVGTVWESNPVTRADGDALGALVGQTRAAILRSTGVPKSTTELARELGCTAPAISAHLATLRRCGMVTSWRSGRSVRYQRTPLATSVVTTAGAPGDNCA